MCRSLIRQGEQEHNVRGMEENATKIIQSHLTYLYTPVENSGKMEISQ